MGLGMINGLILLIVGAVLSIAGAVIAASMQQKSWEVQYRRSIEDAQLRRAEALCTKIIELSDKRIYRLRRLLWSTRSSSTIDSHAARADYSESVFAWNDNFNLFRTDLLAFFGYGWVREFEEELHFELQRLGVIVERAVDSQSPVSVRAEGDLNVLARRIYTFGARLQGHVRDRTLPHFDQLDALTFENADRLPLMYLIKRLYGVSPKMRRV
ncbi:hypothetical protein [Salinisphaera hydrothermalis]|uniref:hypothetical protein n=1 Tax=Salinisphaera hydrothermalis TaxID=563188 RepID=UPI003340A612